MLLFDIKKISPFHFPVKGHAKTDAEKFCVGFTHSAAGRGRALMAQVQRPDSRWRL